MTVDASLLNNVLKKASQLIDRLESQYDTGSNVNLDIENYVLRWDKNKGFNAINWQCPLSLDKLLHVDQQAKLLFENTQQFVEGFPANNVLLWGARGTGKSSLIQAVLGSFSHHQLRIIEINYQDFDDWLKIVEWLHSNHTKKFIIYCDDLSFNQNDMSYRSLKAALDGSLTSLPNNTLMYASSNRRHLLPEQLTDNLQAKHINGEIHHSESVEETISLSDRFGIWLSFHSHTQDQYLDIVQHWLNEYGVDTSLNSYREVALRWALQRGSRSGRIANQFARDYAGKMQLKTLQT